MSGSEEDFSAGRVNNGSIDCVMKLTSEAAGRPSRHVAELLIQKSADDQIDIGFANETIDEIKAPMMLAGLSVTISEDGILNVRLWHTTDGGEELDILNAHLNDEFEWET